MCHENVDAKESKGEATLWRNESACTHTNLMQPASHRGPQHGHVSFYVASSDGWPVAGAFGTRSV